MIEKGRKSERDRDRRQVGERVERESEEEVGGERE